MDKQTEELECIVDLKNKNRRQTAKMDKWHHDQSEREVDGITNDADFDWVGGRDYV